MTLLWRGDLEGAEEMLREGKDEFNVWGFGLTGQQYLDAHLVRVATEQGDLAGARRALEESPRARRQLGRRPLHASTRSSTCSSPRGAGRTRWRSPPRRAAASRPYTSPSASRWRSLSAEALARLGRREEALALAEEEVAQRARAGARRARSATRCGCSASLTGPSGRAARGGGRGARRLAGAAGARQGARGARRRAAARAPADRGARAAARARSSSPSPARRPGWPSTRARSSTRPARGRAPTRSPAWRRSRRPSAAWPTGPPRARPNRDIAQALFVTPKTVEVHLSNAYRKLGHPLAPRAAGGARRHPQTP